jgi:hypothetical protein
MLSLTDSYNNSYRNNTSIRHRYQFTELDETADDDAPS